MPHRVWAIILLGVGVGVFAMARQIATWKTRREGWEGRLGTDGTYPDSFLPIWESPKAKASHRCMRSGPAMNLWLHRKETKKAVLQVLVGLVLWVAIGAVLIYSSLPIFWEHEERLQFHVYPITWRSGVLAVLLLAVTQAISLLVFRCIRWGHTRTSDTHLGNL
jgi:hypothetical protein